MSAWPTSRGAAMMQQQQQQRSSALRTCRRTALATPTPTTPATPPPRRAPAVVAAAASSSSAQQQQQPQQQQQEPTQSQLLRELDALLSRTSPPALAAAPGARSADPAADAAEDAAVALVSSHRSAFPAFGRARMLPKRDYTIDELRLNKIEPEKLLSPRDASLIAVRNGAQVAALAGFVALAAASRWDPSQVLLALAAATFLWGVDAVALGGAAEALAVDSLGRAFLPQRYARRVALHEAAHFLVAYLCGLLPRGYVLSSWGAVAEVLRAGGAKAGGGGGAGVGAGAPQRASALAAAAAAATQAGTTFCDAAFRREVQSGKLSGASLDRYTAAALAGVVAEYLSFGQAEGGVGDVAQLDALFGALGFTQRKAAGQVRWAVLSDAALLRRHARAHQALADAMARGASVGECVAALEAGVAEDVARDPGALVTETVGMVGEGGGSSSSSSEGEETGGVGGSGEGKQGGSD